MENSSHSDLRPPPLIYALDAGDRGSSGRRLGATRLGPGATPQAWVRNVQPGATAGPSSMPDADSDFQKLLFLLIRKAILLLSAIWFDIYIHKHIYQHLYLYSDSTKLEILLPQTVTSWSTSFG